MNISRYVTIIEKKEPKIEKKEKKKNANKKL
jgi:hypothetical protein